MTYAEARQLLRKVYDQWDAVRKLHEILEQAEQAESFLGHVGPKIKAGEAKIQELDAKFHEMAADYQERLDSLSNAIATRQKEVDAEIISLKEKLQSARAAQKVEMDSLTQARSKAVADHVANLEAIKIEEQKMRANLAAVQVEHEQAKARYKALFG